MQPEATLVLLGRSVTPKRRLVLPGGSWADRIYTGLNRALAMLMLVLLAPVFAWVAWRLWREDGNPITFGHYRVGQGGELFRCLKFRTMVRNSEHVLAELLRNDAAAREEWETHQKLRNDPRVTRIGRLLRRTSLDELPQLINIARGEMHFVGPRPVTIAELRRYAGRKRHYLSVKPGLTGLWQVSGRNNTTYEQRVQLDADYVESRTPVLDAWILLRTVGVVLTGDGAL